MTAVPRAAGIWHRLHAKLLATFRWHRWIFVSAMALLHAANIVSGGGWWAFWPLWIWGIPFTIHYLFYKASRTEEAWVAERVFDLNANSYDRAHIESIKQASRRRTRE